MSGYCFVIVHGAWSGAWAWTRVADLLTKAGHGVHVPTLSGLGERSHLDPATITLETHVMDIVNEIRWKELESVVLVAHSYGGIVASGVSEMIGDRIAAMVMIDALIPEDGESFLDMAPGWTPAEPSEPPEASAPGDYLREEDRIWSNAKATPHPTATIKGSLRLTGALERIAHRTFISATFGDAAAQLVKKGWTVRDIACGHDVPIDMPEELAEMLLGAADAALAERQVA